MRVEEICTAVRVGGPREDWDRVDRQSEVRVAGMRLVLCMLQMRFPTFLIQRDAGDVGKLRRKIKLMWTRNRRRPSVDREGAEDMLVKREDRQAPHRAEAVGERVRGVGRVTPSWVRVDVLDDDRFLELRHQTTWRDVSSDVQAFNWCHVRHGK